MRKIASRRAPAFEITAKDRGIGNQPHGGLNLPTGPTWNVMFNLGSIQELVQANGQLLIETATGFRPINAEELRQRLVAKLLGDEGTRRSRRDALAEYPLWAVAAVMLEGEWGGVRRVEVQPDDQTTATQRGLALLRDAIASVPRNGVTTAWLLANRGPIVNEAMKLLRRQVTPRNLGHVLRDLGSGVGIWCSGRHSYGSLWSVGEVPGDAER